MTMSINIFYSIQTISSSTLQVFLMFRNNCWVLCWLSRTILKAKKQTNFKNHNVRKCRHREISGSNTRKQFKWNHTEPLNSFTSRLSHDSVLSVGQRKWIRRNCFDWQYFVMQVRFLGTQQFVSRSVTLVWEQITLFS